MAANNNEDDAHLVELLQHFQGSNTANEAGNQNENPNENDQDETQNATPAAAEQLAEDQEADDWVYPTNKKHQAYLVACMRFTNNIA